MDMMDVLLAVTEDENAEYKITRNNIKSFLVVYVSSHDFFNTKLESILLGFWNGMLWNNQFH